MEAELPVSVPGIKFTLRSFSVGERMKGIEPSPPAWEAGVLPLNYIRIQV